MSGTKGRKKNNLLHGQKRLGSDSLASETQNQEYRTGIGWHPTDFTIRRTSIFALLEWCILVNLLTVFNQHFISFSTMLEATDSHLDITDIRSYNFQKSLNSLHNPVIGSKKVLKISAGELLEFYLRIRKANDYKPGYNHVSAQHVVGRMACQTPNFSWSHIFQWVCVTGYRPISTKVFSVHHHTPCNPDFRQTNKQKKEIYLTLLTGNESPNLPSCVTKSSPWLQNTSWKLKEFCFGLIS